jgi:hypothetical protein
LRAELHYDEGTGDLHIDVLPTEAEGLIFFLAFWERRVYAEKTELARRKTNPNSIGYAPQIVFGVRFSATMRRANAARRERGKVR